MSIERKIESLLCIRERDGYRNGSKWETRVCGLIGNPVEHTQSPVIHNTLAQDNGIPLIYVPFLVENGQLESAVKGAFGLNILGMNVTVPYKNKVIAYLEDIDDLAKKSGQSIHWFARIRDIRDIIQILQGFLER